MKKIYSVILTLLSLIASGYAQSPFKISQRDTTISCNSNINLSIGGLKQNIVNSGLVGYYPMNGNANNIVNSSFNGTVTNASLTTDRFGKNNSAYSFNGISSHISVVSGFGIDTGSMTIMCWAKPDNSSIFDHCLISLYNNQIYVDYNIRFLNDSMLNCIRNKPCIGDNFVGKATHIKNQWNFIAATYNTVTDTIKCYMNGKFVGARLANGNGTACYATTSRLTIGADFSLGSNTRYKGLIDDVMIYNRELNSNEINQNYGSEPNSILWSTSDTVVSIIKNFNQSSTIWSKVTLGGTNHFDTIQVSVMPCISNLDLVQSPFKISPNDTTVHCQINLGLTIGGLKKGIVGSGLVGNYPLNGNAINLVNSASNGIVSNATPTTDRFGNNNSAYSFNGTTSHISALTSFGIDTGSMTIMCWAKPDNASIFDNTLISIYNNQIYADYGLRMLNDSIITGVRHKPCIIIDRVGNSKFVKNQWNFIAVTYNSITDTIKFYMNGSLIGKMLSFGNGTNCNTRTSRLTIGADFSLGSNTRYRGLIDDVMIYNRELNSNEINQNYGSEPNSILWSTSDTALKITSHINESKTIWTKIILGGTIHCDTTHITLAPSTYSFLNDTIISCNTDSVLLTAPSGYPHYFWYGNKYSSFSNNPTFNTPSFGWNYCYTLSSNGCAYSDSIFVNILNPKILGSKQTLCYGDTLLLSVNNKNVIIDTALHYLTTFENSKYYVLNKYTSWKNAKAIAVSLGGNLWIVNSQQENDSIYAKIASNPQFYWIGLYQDKTSTSYSEPSGGWKWVDNSTLTYSNWSVGEPNNTSFCVGEEDFGAINWGGVEGYGSKWNDIPDSINASCLFNRTARAILEFPSIYQLPVTINKTIWSNGDTTEYIKVSPDNSTSYWVKQYNNWNQCSDTVYVQVNKPIAAFHVNSNNQCFNTQRFEFYNNSSVNFGTINYKWDFSDGASDTITNPIKYFAQDTIYRVRLKVTSNFDCTDSSNNILTVYVNPIANYNINNANQCLVNNSFNFTNISTIKGNDSLTSLWMFGLKDSVQSKNTSKTLTKEGKYRVKLILMSSKLCKDSIEKDITVYPKPTISNILGMTTVKPLTTESYSVSLTDSTLFKWQIIGGNIISGQNSNQLRIQWGNLGNGHIGVQATDKNGCQSDSSKLNVSISTVGMEDFWLNEKFRVYPNPTTANINIESIGFAKSDYEIQILDVNGKVLLKLFNSKLIDLSEYPSGIYLMQIKVENKLGVLRIVKY